MAPIGTLLSALLLIFEVLLMARMLVDLAGVLAAGPEPAWLHTARRVTHTTTEPVLAPVRRVLPPVRIVPVEIDLAFAGVFLVVVLVRQIIISL
jgi:YggT family protein